MKILLKDAIEMFGRTLPVLALNEMQMIRFVRSNDLPWEPVRRVYSHWQMKGYRAAELPLIILPSARFGTENFHGVVRRWEQLGGKTLEISEDQVVGEHPIGVEIG